MTAKEKAAILKRIFAAPEKVKTKVVNQNVKYGVEIFNIVSKIDLFWCAAGEYFDVVKSEDGSHYKTVKPAIRKCEYGNIKISDCEIIKQ